MCGRSHLRSLKLSLFFRGTEKESDTHRRGQKASGGVVAAKPVSLAVEVLYLCSGLSTSA